MIRLYDSSHRSVVPLELGPVVSLYSCGITPYDAAHLGHAAVYLASDEARYVTGTGLRADAGYTVR